MAVCERIYRLGNWGNSYIEAQLTPRYARLEFLLFSVGGTSYTQQGGAHGAGDGFRRRDPRHMAAWCVNLRHTMLWTQRWSSIGDIMMNPPCPRRVFFNFLVLVTWHGRKTRISFLAEGNLTGHYLR